jgi:methylglutaconyl-CoA hydratase
MSQGQITSTTTNHITTIEFFHPAQNSLPGHLLNELVTHINQAGDDENTVLIILKSAGDRSFCAGASFTELATIQDFEIGKKFFMGFAKCYQCHQKMSQNSGRPGTW